MEFHDLIGFAGVASILAAYALLQTEKWTHADPRYSLANLIGASLILVSLCFEFNASAFVIEIAWILISLYGLWKWRRRRTA